MKEDKVYRIIEIIAACVISIILMVIVVLGNRFNYVYKNLAQIPNIVFVLITGTSLGAFYMLSKKRILSGRKNNASNNDKTKINNIPTYELANPNFANQICLEENTLSKFNEMLLDYCKTLNLDNYDTCRITDIFLSYYICRYFIISLCSLLL